MNNRLIAQIFAFIVLMGAISVMLGWIFDIPLLKSILPIWVSMKFITALSFFISGLLLILLSLKNHNSFSEIATIVLSFGLLLLMLTFFISLFTGISTGIESLFIKEQTGAVRTGVPGVPAIPTMVCFIFIALAGLIFSFNNEKYRTISIIGWIVALIGGVAVVGYILNIPIMYYSLPGYTSMAFHTAIFFVLMGIGLLVIRKEEKLK
jgi:hypothetical protein